MRRAEVVERLRGRPGLLDGALVAAAALPLVVALPRATTPGGAAAVLVLCAAVVAVAWVAGQWRRTQRAYEESLVDRARRLEHEREQQAVIAVASERARIARDVHDVVMHSISVMIAQADGGRYAAAASPAAAVDALQTVAATGRSALGDMQRLLAVLRQDTGAVLAPQPDVLAVPDLVAGVRASGLPVVVEVTGVVRPLSPATGAAVYRVVQEALTNVLKHAGPAARARVVLAWGPAALRVSVEDDGHGAGAGRPGGHGLAGMHERLASVGGSMEAGPRAGGGFAVTATVPVAPGTP